MHRLVHPGELSWPRRAEPPSQEIIHCCYFKPLNCGDLLYSIILVVWNGHKVLSHFDILDNSNFCPRVSTVITNCRFGVRGTQALFQGHYPSCMKGPRFAETTDWQRRTSKPHWRLRRRQLAWGLSCCFLQWGECEVGLPLFYFPLLNPNLSSL